MDASYGESLLREWLNFIVVGEPIHPYRGEWLQGLELDFYYPDHALAFEFQGYQHYLDKDQIRRDKLKKQLCVSRGVLLITIDAVDLDYTKIRTRIKNMHKQHHALKRPCNCLLPQHPWKEMRPLNEKSNKYKDMLREVYNDFTARKKGADTRRVAKLKVVRAKNALKNMKTRKSGATIDSLLDDMAHRQS